MADTDIDPFVEHKSITEEPTDEHMFICSFRSGYPRKIDF